MKKSLLHRTLACAILPIGYGVPKGSEIGMRFIKATQAGSHCFRGGLLLCTRQAMTFSKEKACLP